MDERNSPEGKVPLPRIVAIMGPNACGKSSLGASLAHTLHGEIISADSRQVFKGLDLGTGKLEPERRLGVRHHLLDVVEPGTDFSLAQYQELAYGEIDRTLQRASLPILVGGTGLYLRAVIEGYELVGVPKNAMRREELEALDTSGLIDHLVNLDKYADSHVDFTNRRRLIRAIEILESGAALADARRRCPRYTTLKLGLVWPDRVMRERIESRLAMRIEKGMIDEVERLLEKGVARDWLYELGLEYRHVLWLLEGKYRSIEHLSGGLSTAIWQFARRQMTWFRKEPDIIWLDAEGDLHKEALTRIASFRDAAGTAPSCSSHVLRPPAH